MLWHCRDQLVGEVCTVMNGLVRGNMLSTAGVCPLPASEADGSERTIDHMIMSLRYLAIRLYYRISILLCFEKSFHYFGVVPLGPCGPCCANLSPIASWSMLCCTKHGPPMCMPRRYPASSNIRFPSFVQYADF